MRAAPCRSLGSRPVGTAWTLCWGRVCSCVQVAGVTLEDKSTLSLEQQPTSLLWNNIQ